VGRGFGWSEAEARHLFIEGEKKGSGEKTAGFLGSRSEWSLNEFAR